PATARPGEKIDLTLCWQAPSTVLHSDQAVTLSLTGDLTTTILSAGAPVQGQYPFSMWQSGERVIDRFAVRVPRTLNPGTYSMTLAAGTSNPIILGHISVPALAHTYSTPTPAHLAQAQFGAQLKLLGYDESTAQAGHPFTLTLYWQPLHEMETDYTVFIHLLDHATGKIMAQVDEQPVQHTYPTSWWASGEVVSDQHILNIPAINAGQYDLQVGLYEQSTGERLLVNGDTGYFLGNLGVSQ
ncbi:MAG TPA: hypothetical protein VGK81_09395, partial [Anaerolineae bacterium]